MYLEHHAKLLAHIFLISPVCTQNATPTPTTTTTHTHEVHTPQPQPLRYYFTYIHNSYVLPPSSPPY